MLVRLVFCCCLLMLLPCRGKCQQLLGAAATADTMLPPLPANGSIDTGRITIRSIAITGNRITREAIVYREVAIASGSTYTTDELENACV